jgi:hypothetical protein
MPAIGSIRAQAHPLVRAEQGAFFCMCTHWGSETTSLRTGQIRSLAKVSCLFHKPGPAHHSGCHYCNRSAPGPDPQEGIPVGSQRFRVYWTHIVITSGGREDENEEVASGHRAAGGTDATAADRDREW